MWEPLRGELAHRAGMTTIGLDVPGTGGSPPSLVPLPLAAVAVLVRRIVRTLGFDEVDVIGLSWGGLLAQQLAFTSPRLVRRVVLASTNAGLGSVPGGWRVLRALASPARYRSRQHLEAALAAFGGGTDVDDAALRVHHAARLARPPTRRGYYAQIVGLTGWSSIPWLRLVRQPTLVICGGADPAVPVINGRLLAALLPGAELAVLAGGGHLVLFEQLQRSVTLIAEFLTRRSDGSESPASGEAS
jgi:pimeloyl-ACP methyl ester carboxylesterase